MEHARARKDLPEERTLGNVETLPAVEAIYRLLQEEYGIDFTHYKPATIERRRSGKRAARPRSRVCAGCGARPRS